MNINEIYASQSSFLKAEHLPPGIEVPVTIESFEETELDGKKKIVLKFQGKEKGLALNKTNAMTIAHVHGPEVQGWLGKSIFLYSTKVDYSGQMVDAIRVRVAVQQAQDDNIPGF
jgi:hypothetical protein